MWIIHCFFHSHGCVVTFDNPSYAIQLANNNVWEASTGYNDLNHTIQISNNGSTSTCFGGQMFSSTSIYDPLYCEQILSLSNALATDIYRAANQINSTGQVPTNAFVIFQAGDNIVLDPGFEANVGASFWARISACFD